VEKIALISSDPKSRKTLAGILQDKGYSVLAAGKADEVPDTVDLVIIDLDPADI
jgi:DNA-binding response OmpR family regulator